MQEFNKMKIHIAGSDYTISTPEDEEYVQRLAKQLDNHLTTLLKKSDHVNITAGLAVLALSYLDDYTKTVENAMHMRQKMKTYIEDTARTRMEIDELKREIESLKRENERLKSKGNL
ncbi:cell division protein ZapA [Candidatus Soleaferrea massiliensis]|uniref:cell division protein ZapA n=1 Tax=Candidatus Soleaferrea massiliensis TaxID=1470354 RepID=UPI00058CB7F2|nr:cell division protein ZapA [Candidatus Soleaferrea massiliensis]